MWRKFTGEGMNALSTIYNKFNKDKVTVNTIGITHIHHVCAIS